MSAAVKQVDLKLENEEYKNTGGVSSRNKHLAFIPAFMDSETGRIELSKFKSGIIAPLHTTEGMPEEWVTERDRSGRTKKIKSSVVSGFTKNGRFYTREQASKVVALHS